MTTGFAGTSCVVENSYDYSGFRFFNQCSDLDLQEMNT